MRHYNSCTSSKPQLHQRRQNNNRTSDCINVGLLFPIKFIPGKFVSEVVEHYVSAALEFRPKFSHGWFCYENCRRSFVILYLFVNWVYSTSKILKALEGNCSDPVYHTAWFFYIKNTFNWYHIFSAVVCKAQLRYTDVLYDSWSFLPYHRIFDVPVFNVITLFFFGPHICCGQLTHPSPATTLTFLHCTKIKIERNSDQNGRTRRNIKDFLPVFNSYFQLHFYGKKVLKEQ